MIETVMSLSNYINELASFGKCSFTIKELETHLGKSSKVIRSSMEHLIAKGEVAKPARGFYVIIPPEYQILGCLPAEYFLPYLMAYWQCDYYACLLTAARYHGATHQAPQVFQVMINARTRPPISCGKVFIRFIANHHLAQTPIQKIATAKSMLTVSTPEGTAMDLLNYPEQSGGINHIATVLTELCENIKPDKLKALLENQPQIAWKQRLGFLFEVLGEHGLADIIKMHLSLKKRVDYVPLVPELKESDSTVSHNSTWKIIVNATVESDI